MLRICLLSILLVALVPASAVAAKKPPRVPTGWVGVAADGPLDDDARRYDREWDRMKRAGVGFARVAFYWRYVQPTADTWDFSSTDAFVVAAARRGIPVLPVVLGAPDWAAADPGNPGSPPARNADYTRFLRALAARYGPGGSLWRAHPYLPERPIRQWQIWNEPNLSVYWSRQPFARRYVKLLRASRRALRRVDGRAQVILGGLPNRSWASLRRIYRVGGRGTFDAVALHPYTGSVANIVEIVRRNRRVTRKAGDGRVPIWLTEISWPASSGKTGNAPNTFEVTDRQQARLLRQTLVGLARERRSLGIGKVSWYTWISSEGTATPSWSGYSGLRRLRGGKVVSAPALKAFRRTVARLRR